MLISVFNPAIRNYIVRLLHSVPVEFYIGALTLFLICICSFFCFGQNKKGCEIILYSAPGRIHLFLIVLNSLFP